MKKIGITGGNGLIGWHLRCYLHGFQDRVQVFPADRETFTSRENLDEFVRNSEVIIHLAGVIRGEDQELEAVNTSLANDLVCACKRTAQRPHIIFSSSTHISKDTPYGESKRTCTRIFREWARTSGAVFTNLILPHVFGERGRPFYNSVVSTFCHQLANNETPKIINDSTLQLLHAQEVAEKVFEIIIAGMDGDIELPGIPIRVSELLAKLQSYVDSYKDGIIPQFLNRLDLQIFNTYRSYLYPHYYPVTLKLYQDARGELFEAIKNKGEGQTFISTTKTGITRGNHYHLEKVERFLVIKGKAVIAIRRMFSDEVLEFQVDGSCPRYIDIPTYHTHNLTNVGDSELVTLFWAQEIFNREKPDTIYELVK